MGICCQPVYTGYVNIDRTLQFLEGLGIYVNTGMLKNYLDGNTSETQTAVNSLRKKNAALNVIHCNDADVNVNWKLHCKHCLYNS